MKDPRLQLLQLPDEIRLQIYRAVVADSTPIAIAQVPRLGPPLKWLDMLSLVDVDRALASDIVTLYWSCNTFTLALRGVEYDYNADEHMRIWLEDVVCDAVESIRHLVFHISLPAPSNTVARIMTGTPWCQTNVTVHLDSPDLEQAIQLQKELDCAHHDILLADFRHSLANVVRQSRKPQVDRDVIWDLYECCYSRRAYQRRRSFGEFLL